MLIRTTVNINFCFKLRKTSAKTFKCLNTIYGGETLKKTAVYHWFKRFKNCPKSLGDKERNGRPSTSKNDKSVKNVRQITNYNYF